MVILSNKSRFESNSYGSGSPMIKESSLNFYEISYSQESIVFEVQETHI